MTENQEVPGRKRRSSEEVKRLVAEFEASGLRQNEFCRNHGLALSTLQRQLKKRRLAKGEAKEVSRLVAVELARKNRDEDSRLACALEVVLWGGRSIKVRPDFDSETLERLLSVLERA
jgi:transposase-like protein